MKREDRRGAALVEALLSIPILLLLTMNAVNFGIYIFDWITLSHAARAAALYQAYNGVVVGANGPAPGFGPVQGVVRADSVSLSNSGSLSVQVCSNKNGTIACSPSQTYAAQADPDPTHYVAWTIDVSYTYVPFFPAMTIPFINVPLTMPAGTIHRQVAMRSMQ